MLITDNLTRITFTCNSIVTTIDSPTKDSLQSIITRLKQNEPITSLALYGTNITNQSIYHLVASINGSVPTTSQSKSPSVLRNTHLITLHLYLKLTTEQIDILSNRLANNVALTDLYVAVNSVDRSNALNALYGLVRANDRLSTLHISYLEKNQ